MEKLAEVLAVFMVAQYATGTDGPAAARSIRMEAKAASQPTVEYRCMVKAVVKAVVGRRLKRDADYMHDDQLDALQSAGWAKCKQLVECGVAQAEST